MPVVFERPIDQVRDEEITVRVAVWGKLSRGSRLSLCSSRLFK
jgi:hypothetical protein